MTPDLFEDTPREVALGEGAVLLGGFARPFEAGLLRALDAVVTAAPFRHMLTPGGHRMSVAMTNCGAVGWVTDRTGYRYDPVDPHSGRRWPYEPGARLSLHRDQDERDLASPIVSVSLGLPATFLFGGLKRSDPPRRVVLRHGDVAVWGGPSRLVYHGIAPLAGGEHPALGRRRVNLTFRQAS